MPSSLNVVIYFFILQVKNRIIIFSLFFFVEPYGRFQQGAFTARGGESVEPEQGLPTRYGRNFRNRHPKVKSLDPSAPPDKDPVMLLNEYGQKRDQPVCIKCALICQLCQDRLKNEYI